MTDDRIKEIYKNDDIYDLTQLYLSSRRTFEKKSLLRHLFAFLAFFIIFSIFLFALDSPDSIGRFFLLLAGAAGTSFLIYFFVYSLFLKLISKDFSENDELKFIEKRINFAQERISSMPDDDVSSMIATILWSYTDKIIRKHRIPFHNFSVVWMTLLFSCHRVLEQHDFLDAVKSDILYTIPEDYQVIICQNGFAWWFDYTVSLYNSISDHFSSSNLDFYTADGSYALLSGIFNSAKVSMPCDKACVYDFYIMITEIHNKCQAILYSRNAATGCPRFSRPIPF